MTWAPGQGTPIHDHCGLWCVEGFWDGELEITQYELLERDGERFRFRAAGGMHAGPGSAGSLIPPHEYHTITNASGDKIAISLHIYKAPMDICSKFQPPSGEWFLRTDSALRRSEEHTSELQSLMRSSYAVFCLKKKTNKKNNTY